MILRPKISHNGKIVVKRGISLPEFTPHFVSTLLTSSFTELSPFSRSHTKANTKTKIKINAPNSTTSVLARLNQAFCSCSSSTQKSPLEAELQFSGYVKLVASSGSKLVG